MNKEMDGILSKEEKTKDKSYVKSRFLFVSEVFRWALIERMEDEYDALIAEQAYKEYLESGKKSRPFEEVCKELGW